MLFQELLHEEREEGKAEAILESEKDFEVLRKYLKAASKAESVEDFLKLIQF